MNLQKFDDGLEVIAAHSSSGEMSFIPHAAPLVVLIPHNQSPPFKAYQLANVVAEGSCPAMLQVI